MEINKNNLLEINEEIIKSDNNYELCPIVLKSVIKLFYTELNEYLEKKFELG